MMQHAGVVGGPTRSLAYLYGTSKISTSLWPWFRSAITGTRNTKTACLSRTSSNGKQSFTSNVDVPSSSQVVICGGGTIGCSVAYHLGKLGFKEVVLLEQGSLSCGTSWHAASLIGALKNSSVESQLASYGTQLYSCLEEETGLSTGWKPCGSILLARTEDRMTYLKRQFGKARAFGIESEFISASDVGVKWPNVRTEDILGALWFPNDGVAVATDICQSLARGARMNGVKILEGVRVEGVETTNNAVSSVTTNKGRIACEIYVNCCGQWSREVGGKSNPPVSVPLHSAEHFYVVTKPMEGTDAMLPVLRDPDGYIYLREWNGGILAGGFEPKGKPCFFDKIPEKFEFQLLPEDWEHFEVLMKEILHRYPPMENAEIRQLVNGPESFTPDGCYLLGAVPEIDNYYLACGMNSAGVVAAAGVGRALAQWIENKEPTMDLKAVDIRRFCGYHNNKTYLRDVAAETLSYHYKLPYPLSEVQVGRGMKCSPLHDLLDSQGSSWTSVMGWEQPAWFSRDGTERRENNDTFGKPRWFDNVKRECETCLQAVGVAITSASLKIEISGSSAFDFLQFLCSNDVDVPVGESFRTLLLNPNGGTEAFCSIYRLDEDRFLLVDSLKQMTRVLHWVTKHSKRFPDVSITDVTSQYSALSVLGPASEKLLQSLTQTPLDVKNFPLNSIKQINVAYATDVLVTRTKGEWKLFLLPEFMRNVYTRLLEHGKHYSVENVGHYALDSLRVEQGIPAWGAELNYSVSPRQAGLESLVNVEKKKEFIADKEVLSRPASGKCLVHLTMCCHDDDNFPWGGEPVLYNGTIVGMTTSASYGFQGNKPVAMANVDLPEDFSDEMSINFKLELANRFYPVQVRAVNFTN